MIKTRFTRLYKQQQEKCYQRDKTINEIVLDYNPATGIWDVPVVCMVNNEPILRKDWDMTLASGDVIDFVQLPMGGGGGGGSNPLRIILSVVLMLVAGWAGGKIAGLMGLTYGVAEGLTLGNLVYGLTAGLVMAAGSMLMGAIFKGPALPTGLNNAAMAESASPTYGLNASNNQARLYQPIGEGFGRMKVVPDRVAQYYGYYTSNDYYLYQVFGLGRGSYEIEALSFGDTVFWRNGTYLQGYEVKFAYYEEGEEVTLFPDNVETSIEVSSQQLLPSNDPEYVGAIGPFSCNPPGTKTSHVVCNITLPQGIGRYDDNGNLGGLTISLNMDFQLIDDYGEPLSEWITYAKPSWHMATLTPQRFSIDVDLAEGRWQCKITRTDQPPIDGRTMRACSWESMFCYLPGTLTYNQATVAVRTKATNNLSQGAASTFSVIYTRILPEYNPKTKSWGTPMPTRKFAAAMSSVLMSKQGGGLDESRIDLDALWGKIDPILSGKNWTFDGYFDGAYKLWTLVAEMCQPYRVVPRLSNGGVTFVYDQPGRPIRHIFTPREIVRGSFSVVYNTFTNETPDSIIWNYLDEDAGFQQREVKAVLPKSETENPVIKSFIGCVNRTQAFEMGIFSVACNRHRRIQLKFKIEGLGRLVFMGDVCSVTHPYFCNLANGAVKDFDSALLTVHLGDDTVNNHEIEFMDGDASDPKYLVITKPSGHPWGPCKVAKIQAGVATLDKEDLDLLIRQGHGDPFEFMGRGVNFAAPITWVLQDSKEFTQRVLIQSVAPSDMFHYEITAINDSDAVDDYDDLPVPPWHYRGLDVVGNGVASLDPPMGFKPTFGGTVTEPRLELFWQAVTGASYYEVELSIGGGDFYPIEKTLVNYIKVDLEPGDCAVRIRGVNVNGVIGPYGVYEFNTNDSYGDPIDIEIVSFEGGNLSLAWTYPDTDPYFELKFRSVELVIMEPSTRRQLRKEVLFKIPPEAPGDLETMPTTYLYDIEKAMQDGGLQRRYLVSLQYFGNGMSTDPTYATAVDTVPKIDDENASINIEETAIVLNSIGVNGQYTGFVVIRGTGPDFNLDQMAEMRLVSSLPFRWDGLTSDTDYWFRIAAKDGLTDLRAQYLDLEYTPALFLHTLKPEPEPEPDPEPYPDPG